MPEDEVITPATETPEIVDIQIVEHSRSDAASDRSYMEAVNNDFKGVKTETIAVENTNVEPEKKLQKRSAPEKKCRKQKIWEIFTESLQIIET